MLSLAAVLAVLALATAPASAQAPGLGASAELVDPHVFRVCADPHDLPFSNQAGEGFENKLAELFASKLGEPTSYTYYPQVIGFVRNTLNALALRRGHGRRAAATTWCRPPIRITAPPTHWCSSQATDWMASKRWRIHGSRASTSASSPARRRPT